MKKHGKVLSAFRTALPYTFPIFASFWFLGFAYGFSMASNGFGPLYPLAMSIVIFGGSLEFVTAAMLISPFAPLQTLVAALMIQARHLFYGISMLDKYKNTGWKKYYLIYGMCDESFSINCTADIPADIDKGWFYFWVTLLNQLYWVSGSFLGGLSGELVTFNTKGLDFVMTAMFVVIFLEQWLKDKHHISEWIGLGSSAICLFIFGEDNFLLATMGCILLLLTLCRKPVEKRLGGTPR